MLLVYSKLQRMKVAMFPIMIQNIFKKVEFLKKNGSSKKNIVIFVFKPNVHRILSFIKYLPNHKVYHFQFYIPFPYQLNQQLMKSNIQPLWWNIYNCNNLDHHWSIEMSIKCIQIFSENVTTDTPTTTAGGTF